MNDTREPTTGATCARVSVLVIGAAAPATPLVTYLRERGHPVEARPITALTDIAFCPTVSVLLCRSIAECCGLADALHSRWAQAPVVILSEHVTNELEEQVAAREFAALRKLLRNEEEIHALIHAALEPHPDTTPHGLKPRFSDHPPTSDR